MTTPEEMPVTETIELLGRLRAETGAHVSAVIANRVLPAMFNRREQAIVDHLGDAMPLLVEAAGPAVTTVVEAANLTEMRRRTGAGHLERLRTWLASHDDMPEGLPIVTVPEMFSRGSGPRSSHSSPSRSPRSSIPSTEVVMAESTTSSPAAR